MVHLYQTPIKMPRGTHYGSDYWIVYSYKLKRIVHLYSMLEYANFLTLEMDPKVEYFCEQPLKIEDPSQKKSSVFDFWVQYKDSSSEFQEVKYSAELTDNTETALRSQNQIKFQREWCESHEHNYKVVTDEILYKESFKIQNLELLHSHLLRNGQIPRYLSEEFFKILGKNCLSIEEIQLLNTISNNDLMSLLAYHFYQGNVAININARPIDKYTEVKICERKNTIS